VAGVVGAGAGGALVVVRARQKQKRHEAVGIAALQKGMREVSGDMRRRFRR
jgi:surface antigen